MVVDNDDIEGVFKENIAVCIWSIEDVVVRSLVVYNNVLD